MEEVVRPPRMARRQHMRITWGGDENGPDLGVRFAAQVRTCEARSQQTPLGRGLMRNGTPCRVWPLEEEQGTEKRAIAAKTKEVVLSSPRPGRTREVVMVTDMETGQKTIQMRVADGVSERKAWRPGMSTEWQVKSKRPAEPTQRPESRQRRRLGQDRSGRTSNQFNL